MLRNEQGGGNCLSCSGGTPRQAKPKQGHKQASHRSTEEIHDGTRANARLLQCRRDDGEGGGGERESVSTRGDDRDKGR